MQHSHKQPASLFFSVSHSLPQHCLLFKLEDRQERGLERDGGREQSKEEQKRLQCCREPSLFASGLTNRKRTGKRRGQKKSRGKEMGEEIYLIGEKERSLREER